MEVSFFVELAKQFGVAVYIFYGLCAIGLVTFIASITAPFTKTKIDDNIVTIFGKYRKIFVEAFFKFAVTTRKEKK